MKPQATLLAAAITAAIASSAHAQTVIDITGSTAGRSAVHTQILGLLQGETLAWNGGSSASGATRVIYKGTYDGSPVIVRTFWSGSAAGVRDVANRPQLANAYFDVSTDTSAGTTSAGVNIASPVFATGENTISEIGFSDVFQTSTAFTSNPLVQEDSVGVIPFKFFKNEGASAGLTNVTPGLFRALYGSLGELPLSMFTGIAADAGRTVYATGRDEFSGTRITTLAETGAGVFAGVNQYQATPANNVISSLTFVGNNGYSSGSGVSTMLGGTFADGDIIGYLGASDWGTAVSGGATELAYNGVLLGTAANYEDKIRNGQYSFWGYLHQSSMTLTGTTADFYDDLRDGLLASPGNGLVLISSMNVERAADGAAIIPR